MSQDAIQEFKVFRSQFDAQYGHALNAVAPWPRDPERIDLPEAASISVATTHAMLATHLPPASHRSTSTESVRRLGGPVRRDRSHFFAVYELLAGNEMIRTLSTASSSYASQPPLALAANWPVPNTCSTPGCISVQNLLGRVPPSGTAGGNTIVTLLDNEHRLYADTRRAQVDMRVAKIFRLAKRRLDVGVDAENLLNTNYTTAYDNTYQFSAGNTTMGGTWNNPTAIYTPRYARLNFTVSF